MEYSKTESFHYTGITTVLKNEYDDLDIPFTHQLESTVRLSEQSTTLEWRVLATTPLVQVPMESSLTSALSSTLDTEEGFNDINLHFGQDNSHENKPLQVSKFVLMARSPVFKAMFQSDFKEAKDSTVPIPDISPEVGQEMITYMYTDKTPNISTMPEELWQAAEKYQLPGLKALCENELAVQLELDNAARILLFASQYCGDGALKDYVLSFITRDKETCSQVMRLEEWGEVRKFPELVQTVTDKYFDVPSQPAEKKARLSCD